MMRAPTMEVAMDRPLNLFMAGTSRDASPLQTIGRLAAALLLFFVALPALGIEVPVRDGQTVKVKLRNVLTTDNCRKNDRVSFEVTEDVLINGHVVIAKGAPATGKVDDIKGAYKPRAKDAEVVFHFMTVQAVDGKELPLRYHPEKPRKGSDSKANEVHERSEIPGQITRIVGADKGKDYEVYVDGSFSINAPNAIAVAPVEVTPVTVQPATPVPSPVAPSPVAVSPMIAAEVASAPSSVDFHSTPDGADIWIDGTMVGNTPSTLRMTPGHHTIEIRMAGYRTWSRNMVVDPESHPSVRATLVKQ